MISTEISASITSSIEFRVREEVGTFQDTVLEVQGSSFKKAG